MRPLRALLATILAAGCGGSDTFVNHVDNPQPQSGGGLGSGAVAGELNVFVIDDRTEAAVAGASVRVGAADDMAPLLAMTDDNGYALIADGKLEGAQIVTVSAPDYAASTWFGVNGAVVTIPLQPAAPEEVNPDIPTATLSGTIAGWESIPDPPDGFALAAGITYSRTENQLSAPENNVMQEASPVSSSLPANTCLRLRYNQPPLPPIDIDQCDWTLHTRTGPQTIYAGIALVSLAALQTGNVGPDDYQIVGYAALGGFDPQADDSVTSVELPQIADQDLVDTDIAVGDLPDGLQIESRWATLELGAAGRVVLPPPEISALLPGLDVASTRLPKPIGDLAGSYTFHGSAAENTRPTPAIPSSLIVHRDVELGSVDLGDWLALPADLAPPTPTSPAYSFTRVPGASVHNVSIDATDGTAGWNVLWLDPAPSEASDGGAGATDAAITFTLPTLSPDPLPSGILYMIPRASDIPGFDPLDFDHFTTMADHIVRQSTQHKKFAP
jgi:hypothetical protein